MKHNDLSDVMNISALLITNSHVSNKDICLDYLYVEQPSKNIKFLKCISVLWSLQIIKEVLLILIRGLKGKTAFWKCYF